MTIGKILVYIYAECGQAERQTGRRAERQTGRRAGRRVGRQSGRQTDKQTGGQTDILTVIKSGVPTDRHRIQNQMPAGQ